MSDRKNQLLKELLRVFPQTVIEYPAAPHKCLECDEISVGLKGRSWVEVPSEFLPVPLPASAWLFLAGLSSVAALIGHRRPANDAPYCTT